MFVCILCITFAGLYLWRLLVACCFCLFLFIFHLLTMMTHFQHGLSSMVLDLVLSEFVIKCNAYICKYFHGFSLVRCKAISWTYTDVFSIGPLGTNFSEITTSKYNAFLLTHWGRVTHICVNKILIIGSDNGLSPDRHQAIIWTSPGILLIGPLGTNLSEILGKIHIFSFKKIHLKMSSAKWRPFVTASMS